MTAGHGYEDNAFAFPQTAGAMDDREAVERPARQSFVCVAGDLALSHARIVFEPHGREAVVTAHYSDKAGNRGDLFAFTRESFELVIDVEVFGLNAHVSAHRDPKVLVNARLNKVI